MFWPHKLHEDAAIRKKLKKVIGVRAPEPLAAFQEVFRGALGLDDKKFTKKLHLADPARLNRNAFARAAFAWSRGHIGFGFRLEQGGEVALQALRGDVIDGEITINKVVPGVLSQIEDLRSLHLLKMRGKKLSKIVSSMTSLQELRITNCKLDTC